MQQVSQGSLKLQAHHDKIANSGSQSTKNRFLHDEVYYLTQLKEHCKALQSSLRPSSNPTPPRITKLIQNLRKELLAQVIATRRETALAQLPLGGSFEENLVHSYEQGAQRMDKRQGRMEELVQRQQDRNRAKEHVYRDQCLRFKNAMIKKASEEFFKRTQTVHQLFKRKLLLAAKIKIMQANQARHHLLHASKHKYSQLEYFAQRNAKYYRSKTLPTRPLRNSSSVNFAQFRRNRISSNVPPYQLLHCIQRNLFQSEFEQLKCENSRLKCLIDTLNAGIRQRENLSLLQNLTKSHNLQAEESKARELLFYMIKNQTTREKIESCSYYWAASSPSQSPRNKWKSKEDNIQEEKMKVLNEKRKLRGKRRVVSVQKIGRMSETSSKNRGEGFEKGQNNTSFSKIQQLKSNERTNASYQCWDHSY